MTRLTLLLLTAVTAGSIAIACAPSSDETTEEGTSSIVGGVEARRHEHAALVDIDRGTIGGACSGSVIAPRVVLTAGHCVVGALGFTVTAPYSIPGIRQRIRGRGVAFDYTETANRVNPNQHDVALIILDEPIRLAKYPVLQRGALAADTPITKIGRIQDGRISNTSLFESRAMRVVDGRAYGYPYSYVSSEVIQSGDSGGPDVIAASDPPVIVAVNSGAGGGTEVLARVDLMATWIDGQVNANGGYAKPADAGADADAASPDAAMEAGVDAAVDAAPDAAKEAGTGNGDGGGKADSGKSTDPNPDPPSSEEPGSSDSNEEDDAPVKKKKSSGSGASSGCTTGASSIGAAMRGGGFLMFALLLATIAAARRRRF